MENAFGFKHLRHGGRAMIRIRSVLPLFAITLLCLAALQGCAKRETEIKVGEYGSLTGSTATFGISSKNGIELYVDNLNVQGGIGGKKIHVLVEDDQSKPEEAATAVNKLIAQDGVVAVLGEVASSRSLAAAPICQSAGVPMISPSSTNPRVTDIGDQIFRVCYIDPFQGMVIARFAKNTLHFSKAAVFRDNKNDYSVGLANFFTESFRGMGGTIVTDHSYSEGDQDFEALSGPPNAEQKAARAKLRDLIAATRDYPGVTGKISLDDHRNAVKPAVFLGIENRGYKFVATVEP